MIHGYLEEVSMGLIGFFITSLSVLLIYPKSEKWGLIDIPNLERKKHASAVPTIGGLAIASSLVIFQLIEGNFLDFFLLATLMVVALGTVDDKYDISPAVKILIQIIAALFIFFGTNARIVSLGTMPGGTELMTGYLSLPITLLFIVGMINAINMVDGIDGLAAGLCLMSVFFLICLANLFKSAPDPHTLKALFLLAGSIISFLVFNMGLIKNRKVFLGDAGSMKLGLLISFFLIEVSQKPNAEGALPASMVPWVVALPLIDTVAVIALRLYKKRPIMAGDRTHLHHCLIDAGWSSRKALSLILLSSVLLFGVGLQTFNYGGLTSGIFFCVVTCVYMVTKNAYILRSERTK